MLEYIRSIITALENTSTILQTLVGSALSVFLLWLGRFFFKLIVKSIKYLRVQHEINKVTKIIIHKYYVNTNGLYFFSKGFFLVIYQALINITKGFISIFIGFSIYFIFFQSNFIIWIFIYLGLQFFIEAFSWLNPALSRADLSKYDKKIVESSLEKLVNEPKKSLELTHDETKLNEVKKMKDDVDKLYHELIGKDRKIKPNDAM